MATHVDVVKNEWLAGFQHPVARLFLDDNSRKIRVEADDQAWVEIALRPIAGLHPDEHPEEFLELLADHLHGTYLFATHPHDEGACPYHDVVVPIHSVDASRQPQPASAR